jgi:predicted phosphodiesterase
MRLAILADVHGNLPALEAVLVDVEQQEADGILVAGDTVDGPYALEPLQALRARGSWMIRGNREQYMLAYDRGDAPPAWRSGAQWAGLRWIYHHLDREALDFIASLPDQGTYAPEGAAAIRVVHGAPQGVSALLLPDRSPELLGVFDRVASPTWGTGTSRWMRLSPRPASRCSSAAIRTSPGSNRGMAGWPSTPDRWERRSTATRGPSMRC